MRQGQNRCFSFDFADDRNPICMERIDPLPEGENYRRSEIMRRTIRCMLTEKQRKCLTMYFAEQKNIPEIAEIMGVDKSTVSRHIKAGKTKIRDMLTISGAKGDLHFYS